MRSLANWCYDHNRTVVIGWIIAFFSVAIIGMGIIGGSWSDDFALPGTESQKAQDLLESKFPTASGDTSQLVFHVDEGTLADKRAEVEAVVAEARKQPTVVQGASGVTDPFDGTVSEDGHTAFSTITHSGLAGDFDLSEIQDFVAGVKDGAATKAAKADGIEVELGGNVAVTGEQEEPAPIGEIVGLILAYFLVLLVIRAFSASFIPIITAFISIVIAISIVVALSNVFSIPEFTSFLVPLIGIGVGVDYGLLTLSRVRNELAKGYDMRTSVASTLDTAGRSVMFAGITVIIALLGMLLLGIKLLYGPAIAPALAVALTMATTLTLVPALLASRPFNSRFKVGTEVNPDEEGHFWARYSRFAQRHPASLLAIGMVILVVCASPVLGMRLAFTDSGNGDPDLSSTKAYNLLADGFGPGFNGPLLVVAELDDASDPQASLEKLRATYEADSGVAAVGEATLNEAKDTAIIQVTPTAKPQDQASTDTLDRLREETPKALEGSGIVASIGGFTAATADFSAVIAEKLPLFIGVVVGLSLILLMMVFRSIAIPIKAGFMNLLSIGVALGITTWVFQDGHLLSLLGVEAPGPIAPFLPVMLFAIIFGLSMDYEIFLVTRMHEEWEHKKDSDYAVRHGLALTGKVVTVAGLIMIFVFGAFMLNPDPISKLFGLAFAVAIFFDAFVIRMLVVPSIMFLIGKNSWWIPPWLDKILPRISIEGPEDHAVGDKAPAASQP